MDWFYLQPGMRGWKTSDVLRVMHNVEPKSGFIPKNKRKQVLDTAKAFKESAWRPREAVEDYYAALKDIEEKDLMVVTTTDTLSTKQPTDVRMELPAAHPSNKNIQNLTKRLDQTKQPYYIVSIDPPYNTVIDNNSLHKDLREHYLPHGFRYWDD